jgi:hypothetical protein
MASMHLIAETPSCHGGSLPGKAAPPLPGGLDGAALRHYGGKHTSTPTTVFSPRADLEVAGFLIDDVPGETEDVLGNFDVLDPGGTEAADDAASTRAACPPNVRDLSCD